jgi:hypothetical protein
MLMPGFRAELSLYNSTQQYQAAGYNQQSNNTVRPTQLAGGLGFPFNCGGTADQCISTLCAGKVGKDRALCVTLCNAPSICGGCNCSCSPDCTRTCSRTCCRTIQGPPFRQSCCTGKCFGFPGGDGGVLKGGVLQT